MRPCARCKNPRMKMQASRDIPPARARTDRMDGRRRGRYSSTPAAAAAANPCDLCPRATWLPSPPATRASDVVGSLTRLVPFSSVRL
ncbi:hypothetical protein E2562_001541 [Oryza meyeriana var. granulata]|uniref:Uncharacterized protein n=1 Tax=Oryza meyeriana var. granulata TaxID=110450 RepID=A0A6G1DF64_9ORYZ|nr:hypothetical protein E2562_001541 [Oryza meyeriana var. granulata]